MQIPIIAAALACGLVLTACGAEEPATGGDRRTERREALLAFAKCMREQGIDMPDPQFQEGGRVFQRGPDERVSPEKMRKADETCRKHMEEIEPPELSEEQREEMRKGALAHAQCMREQGLEHFPDPTFDEDGGAQIRIGPGTGLDPDDPKFQAAEKACRDELPDLEEGS
jgi:hypothetical protein